MGVQCWTGLSDKEMVERDPVLAREIIRRRKRIMAELEAETAQNEAFLRKNT